MINDALRQHLDRFVIAYLDDILVYSTTLKEQVLECLSKRNLRLKPEKCEFLREEVDFLGFVVGRRGIRMDPENLRAVGEWKPPTKVKEVQAFLGLMNYNRKFIKGYSAKRYH